MRKRSKLTKKLMKATSQHEAQKLLKYIHGIETKLNVSYTTIREQEEAKAIKFIKTNPKYFYSYANRYSKTSNRIGPLMNENGENVYSNKEISELLRKQYDSVFSTPHQNMIVNDPDTFFPDNEVNTPKLQDITFNEQDIINAINKLSESAASGPDGFPAILLKKCKFALAQPLYLIWRKILDNGNIPQILKEANILPIHKGGSRLIPKNYRPISLTSHLMKTFERVFRAKVVTYLEQNQLLNDSQHGFRSGRSSLSQLIQHHDRILEMLENGTNADVIYLDFAKAFDKVDHGIICHKLKSLGITGKIGKWLHNFLSDRFQKVHVNGALSSASTVISSVPPRYRSSPSTFPL